MSTADMPPSSSSWKQFYSASSKFLPLKGLINHSVSPTRLAGPISRAANAVGATDERRQSWRAWATRKLRGKRVQDDSVDEVLTLFPGWAARRYARNEGLSPTYSSDSPVPFEIDVFVSGYAVSRRSKESATRSQRAFLRLAKSFAALPRIIDQHSQANIISTGDSFNEADIPKVSEEFGILDQEFQSLGLDDFENEDQAGSDTFIATSHSPSLHLPKQIDTPADVLHKLHSNLESRLRLFWSSILPSRTVRLHLFASSRSSPTSNSETVFEHRPLASQDVQTSVDGSFGAKFRISWEDLWRHPSGVDIVFCDLHEEFDLTIVAELLPPLLSSSASSSTLLHDTSPPSQPQSQNSFSYPHWHSHSHNYPHLHNIFTALPGLPSLASLHLSPPHSALSRFLMPTRTAYTRITTPITHTPIRVISDIDDTVKYSGVTEGARIAFHNVFVKELKDGIIPGMGEWYTNMWNKGVRFHYVSNGPFEYLSLLYEFFSISGLPHGSIKLKSYAGRSFLSGLLSNPAARKRAGVVDVLDSLPCSKFILIGDSGEQDLELYAELAKERPKQIIAIFIRDAEESLYDPIDDPTGSSVVRANMHNRTCNGNVGILPASSNPPTADRNEPTTLRFGKAKRAFSDTFASMRASVSDRLPDGPLREDDEFTDTPKPQSLPTFTFSSPTPDSIISSSVPSLSRLIFSTSLTSTPIISEPTAAYVTEPPVPITPLSVHTHGPTLPSVSRDLSRSYGSSTSRLPSSSPIALPSTSSRYYRPEPSIRFTGNRSQSFDFLGVGSSEMDSGHEFGSTWSSSASSIGSSGSIGRMSEGEKKKQELQGRVYRVRMQIPGCVKLRVFRDPKECTEDENLLLSLGLGVRE